MKIKDDNIYYEDKEKHLIYSETEWKKLFKKMADPCKWYNCDNEDDKKFCEHPDYFCPKESGLVEVYHYGLDEDGSLLWEEV